jgi:trehalose 6-phosphate phosphatase
MIQSPKRTVHERHIPLPAARIPDIGVCRRSCSVNGAPRHLFQDCLHLPGCAMTDTPIFDDRSALFLDIDGTLLEIAPRPDAVVVPAGLPELLLRIAARLDGALAVVSGRTLADIDGLLKPARLPAAGQHGLERRDVSGAMQKLESDPTRLVPVREALLRFVSSRPGMMIEDKLDSLAIHFRNAPEAAADTARFAAELLAGLGHGYKLLQGKSVIELQPDSANKGRAIDRFMSEPPFQGRRPIFVGDDVTDESGFEAVNALGGQSARIESGRAVVDSRAKLRIADPTALRAWLASLVPATVD